LVGGAAPKAAAEFGSGLNRPEMALDLHVEKQLMAGFMREWQARPIFCFYPLALDPQAVDP